MSHHHADTHDHSHDLGHIVPKDVYLKVFLSLLTLTAVTVAAHWIDISPGWNIAIAMAIASVKAILVLLFFMHLKYENKAIWIFVAFPIVLVFILIGGVYTDNPLRVQTDKMIVHKK